MKTKIFLILALSGLFTASFGQQSDIWNKWSWLTGEWIGEGSGQPGAPIFRLTYSLLGNGTINTKFEMSQDGEKFMVYIEGKSKKLN